MADKAIQPDKRHKIALEKRGIGRIERFRDNTRPEFNAERVVRTKNCRICTLRGQRKMFVCSRCGNCQYCGGMNLLGVINQACMACGNGMKYLQDNPPLDAPMLKTVSDYPDHQNDLKHDNVELKPHKKKQSSGSIHLSNRNGG